MDDFLKKEIGVWILIIAGAFGAVLVEYVILLGWSPLWIGFVAVSWYATDILISAFVWHYFKTRKEDIQKQTPILSKVESIPENSTKPEDPLIRPT